MKTLSLTALAAFSLLCLTSACGADTGDTDTDASTGQTDPIVAPTTGTTGEVTTSGPDPSTTDTGTVDESICAHLGGMPDIEKLVGKFLAIVIADDRINAYFLKNTIDLDALATCVATQLGQETGCLGVTYACRPMLAAHKDLGISTNDFMDFAEDFTKAWNAHAGTHPDLTPEDFTAVFDVLASLAPQIVEDADSNLTIYQRVGRKPGIKALVGDPNEVGSFVATVAADPAINGFFGPTDFMRLNTCLTRQLQGLDGPDTYGLERDDLPPGIDPGATAAAPCRDMVTTHAALVDPNDALGISPEDFMALVTDLVTAMNTATIPQPDQDLILAELAPLCPMIVTVNPMGCM